MAALLEVNGLIYRYGNRIAVDQVSFTIERGEIFGLLGPNGAGKTTTIACLVGLLAPHAGSMVLSGQPYDPARRMPMRKNLGLVPQDLALYEGLSARENLSLFAKLNGVPTTVLEDRIQKYLDFSGLSDRATDRVQTFSGGMKRRLNLASGIIHEPPIVLLDEPTVGVDPQSRNHLFESIETLKRSGTSVLYTTHYMEEAQRLCDRIAIMNEGRIIAIGTPKQLVDSLQQDNANLETVFLKLTGRKLRDE